MNSLPFSIYSFMYLFGISFRWDRKYLDWFDIQGDCPQEVRAFSVIRLQGAASFQTQSLFIDSPNNELLSLLICYSVDPWFPVLPSVIFRQIIISMSPQNALYKSHESGDYKQKSAKSWHMERMLVENDPLKTGLHYCSNCQMKNEKCTANSLVLKPCLIGVLELIAVEMDSWNG